jgi:ADP-ribose pyrophosphatase
MDILGIEKLTDEKWLNLFAAKYRHNGKTGRWVFASRKPDPRAAKDSCDAVLIVPLLHTPDQSPRLVVIKEFRVPVGDYIYSFPAGLLEPGEDIEETIRREVLEETGYEVVRIKRVSPPLYSTSGMTDETVAMAFIDVRAVPGSAQSLEGSEDIEVLLLDFAGVCRLCDAADVRFDAKAWAALYLYRQLGRLE